MQEPSLSVAAAAPPGMPLLAAADLQDHLLVASNDLDRLHRLLEDAGTSLMSYFQETVSRLETVTAGTEPCHNMVAVRQNLASAITALQFQDMATQLIAHTTKRLRNCADRLAAEAMGDDEDGAAVVEEMPLRPNPVTQDEMDAGSIELF